MWADLKAGRRPGMKQLGLLVYGGVSFVSMLVMTALALFAWNTRLGPVVRRGVPAPWDVLVLLAAVVLITFPIWVRIAKAVVRLVKRVPRRALGTPEPVEVTA
jgi:putative peptide zinc metalloprotease protein